MSRAVLAPRYYSSATLLGDGQVLIVGGYDPTGVATEKALAITRMRQRGRDRPVA